MRVILDTNVFISGIFFGGPPYRILKAWHDGKIQLVISREILEEYWRVGETLAKQFSQIDISPFLHLLSVKAELISVDGLPEPVCDDPDDDMFITCAIAVKTKVIISGDKHLPKISGYRNIDVLRPRKFVDYYL